MTVGFHVFRNYQFWTICHCWCFQHYSCFSLPEWIIFKTSINIEILRCSVSSFKIAAHLQITTKHFPIFLNHFLITYKIKYNIKVMWTDRCYMWCLRNNDKGRYLGVYSLERASLFWFGPWLFGSTDVEARSTMNQQCLLKRLNIILLSCACL